MILLPRSELVETIIVELRLCRVDTLDVTYTSLLVGERHCDSNVQVVKILRSPSKNMRVEDGRGTESD